MTCFVSKNRNFDLQCVKRDFEFVFPVGTVEKINK